nr:Chain P, ALQDA peptide, ALQDAGDSSRKEYFI [synthetic construct]
ALQDAGDSSRKEYFI